ncbi:EAL domain-containing protein [Roseibium aggregatum]|uniref:bifunctional diguanylate cyclase/phosphodiesterase n=1 Tax=Roseibium aggregatum TaxID=187304 RepID=UPI001E4F8BF6|nr:EAL domain-containing protein [Roseibium aggregatum]UES41503.1 EAL domain-containing protein [Roseibium aggregatum]
MVLCSIGLVSGLAYLDLSRSTQENATIRLDRAARAAASMLHYGTNESFKPVFADSGEPIVIRVSEASAKELLQPSEKLDGLIETIGKTNQGAANLFSWSGETRSFDRFATTFSHPKGEPPPAFSISEGHPAFASLSAGQPYAGNVPVQGRFRLAYMTPIVTDGGKLVGAIAVDVGWADDLTLAENRLKTRMASAAIVILFAVILVGGLFLRFELRPLRRLAKTADELATGTQPKRIPFTDRRDEIGDLAHGLERVTDLQDKLHKLAYTDPVTTAGNRARYFSDLSEALQRARSGTYSASLIHLDFNGFAKVNDTFGQQVGNRVLLQAYARLANIFGPSAQIARISADDFCILLPFDSKGAIAEDYAVQAIDMLSVPFQLEEGEIRVEPSIGIALLPQDAEDAETAHRMAGLALRAAKRNAGARYEFFSPPLNDRVQSEMLTETLLRAALQTRQLVLHYQPQVCPADGRLIGLEALLRWPHEKRGLIPPGEFIPIAEKTGLILDLGQYVLESACKQAAEWRQAGFEFGQVSINVSPLQFRQSNFADTVRQTLNDYGLPASYLCLEVTENVFVDTREQLVLNILSELQQIGVQLSLDDFGSGYSSLNYLHRLPFQELKIDRAFISGADTHPQREQLFEAIVRLGRSLGLRVIAEGAETAGEFALTVTHHCDGLQGYYCSPAVPANLIQSQLQSFRATLKASGIMNDSDRSSKKRA